MTIPNTTKIGIFDSGLGGLTVFKSLSSVYRDNTSFIYLGDLAHLPYGDKSKESIIKYSQRIVDFFISKKVDIIIVACNSASSVALGKLQIQNPNLTIIGTIEPSVQQAIQLKDNQNIGIIGTETTINSNAYNMVFKDYEKYYSLHKRLLSYEIYSISCPLFVPIVEEGWENTDIAHQIAAKYLSKFNNTKLDTIILACTHYPMLINTLKSVFKNLGHTNLNFIDSGDAITQYFKYQEVNTYEKLMYLSPKNESGNLIHENDEFYVTDTSYQFHELSNRFLGVELSNIQLISL